MPNADPAKFYYPDTLVNPDTYLGKQENERYVKRKAGRLSKVENLIRFEVAGIRLVQMSDK